MGRGHVVRLAAAGAALVLALAAPATAAISWRLLDGGAAGGSAVSTTKGYIAVDRAATAAFASRLPASAKTKLATVDFSTTALVAIIGEFGCSDQLISVRSLEQHGETLTVALLQRQPKPGTARCMAIFATYRILSVDKSSLGRPHPTRVVVTLARA